VSILDGEKLNPVICGFVVSDDEALDEILVCLELLVEMRLALSSLITVEARVVVVVPVSVVSSLVPEDSSILLDDIPSSSAVICPQEFKNIPRMITKVIETN
jgi:hypothetical protein